MDKLAKRSERRELILKQLYEKYQKYCIQMQEESLVAEKSGENMYKFDKELGRWVGTLSRDDPRDFLRKNVGFNNIICRGATSVVYRAIHKVKNTKVCIKVASPPFF
jgi:hypothetical protein